MANGDAAAAAGMDVVPATAKVRLGYDEINKSRDYVAERANRNYLGISVGPTAPTSPILNHIWFKPVS